MSTDLVESVAQRFQSFAAPYLEEPGDDFAYRLKVEHTNRVRAIATDIADASGVSQRVHLAARLAALLHDVGRFPQYKQYRTFRDAESANHARLSVRHTLREGMLAGAPPDLRRMVLGAVFLHNVRTLPTALPPDTLAAARIVRDSDKLDIFRVMIAHFSQTEPEHPEVALHVKPHPTAYTQEILTALLKGETGDYSKIVWVNDFKLMVAGCLYDLNYQRSCQLLHDHGYLDTIFDTLPQDQRILELRDQISGHLARRLADD
ncbi:MAG: HD domain-containing protein [Humidesulfovibrio sp.]|nr:HD domain-containing protein [Humidesulfovibrio sp.]